MRYIVALLLSTLLLNASQTVTVGSLEWQDNEASKSIKLNWKDAIDYCEEIELKGHSDWRLPSIKELQSIVDVSRYDLAIKRGFSYTVSDAYWSVTEYVSDAKVAWNVYFMNGSTYHFPKSQEYYVRCVRARQ